MAVVHIATAAATAIVIQIVAITTTTDAIWRFILGTLHHAITGAEEYHHMRSGVSLATKPTISIPIRSNPTKADASGATRHLIDTGKKAGPRPGFFIARLYRCNGFLIVTALSLSGLFLHIPNVVHRRVMLRVQTANTVHVPASIWGLIPGCGLQIE